MVWSMYKIILRVQNMSKICSNQLSCRFIFGKITNYFALYKLTQNDLSATAPGEFAWQLELKLEMKLEMKLILNTTILYLIE